MDRLSFDSAMAILASTGGDFVHMTFKRKITSSGNGDSSVASGHHAARGRGRRRGKVRITLSCTAQRWQFLT